MKRQLIAHTRIHLAFYRRNRVLQLAALFLALIFCQMFIPSLVFSSRSGQFELIRTIQRQMSGFITVTTAALALVTIHYHTSTRCVKMVLTKPSPPSVWILSVYCSAVLVAGALFLASFVIALALFLAWGIPFQYGLIFVTVQDFAECLVIYSYLTMLTVIVHPAIALLVALVMQEGMFYYLMILAMAAHQGIAGTVKGILLKALEQLCAFFYMVVPSYSPFKESVKEIARSYRVTGAGWWYLACIVSYALIFTAFCYVVTVLVFKRKRYI